MTDETGKMAIVDPDYDQFIRRLAEERDGRTISNSSDRHALSILRGVFGYAKKYVKLFSGSLSPSVYNDEKLIDAVKSFVSERKGDVEILIQHPEKVDSSNKFLEALRDLEETGHVKVFSVGDENSLKSAEIHFLVSDDHVYRIEVDVDAIKAIGSFNDEQRAAVLKSAFDSSFDGDVKEWSFQSVGQSA